MKSIYKIYSQAPLEATKRNRGEQLPEAETRRIKSNLSYRNVTGDGSASHAEDGGTGMGAGCHAARTHDNAAAAKSQNTRYARNVQDELLRRRSGAGAARVGERCVACDSEWASFRRTRSCSERDRQYAMRIVAGAWRKITAQNREQAPPGITQ